MKFADIDNPNILHVCTSGHCSDGWKCCGYAGICPHSKLDDGERSYQLYQACVDMENGAKIKDVVSKYHISIKQLIKYRDTVNRQMAKILAQFPDCTTECLDCTHIHDCPCGIH